MNDLNRMKKHYEKRDKDLWSPFNCYPFFLSCKQTYILTKILNHIDLKNKKLLDVGAGEGNFLLKLIALGIQPANITAVEFLQERYDVLKTKLPHIKSLNDDYLNVVTSQRYDLITIMAVLTSITDNDIRYKIVEKALNELSDEGTLIIYDYFSDSEEFLTSDYRALSQNKIEVLANGFKIKLLKKVYLKSRYANKLCALHLQAFIPLLESLKIFNDNYSFMVITK